MKEMVSSNPCMSRLKKKYDDFIAAGGSPDQFVTARKVHMDIKDICLKDTVKEMSTVSQQVPEEPPGGQGEAHLASELARQQ